MDRKSLVRVEGMDCQRLRRTTHRVATRTGIQLDASTRVGSNSPVSSVNVRTRNRRCRPSAARSSLACSLIGTVTCHARKRRSEDDFVSQPWSQRRALRWSLPLRPKRAALRASQGSVPGSIEAEQPPHHDEPYAVRGSSSASEKSDKSILVNGHENQGSTLKGYIVVGNFG